MSQWRRVAIETIPNFKKEIETADNPMALWIELLDRLELAYEKQAKEDEVIAQIYSFAHWCLRESRSPDVFSAVVVGFYESLPTLKDVRSDLPNRVRWDDFLYISRHWSYFLSDEEWREFQDEFAVGKSKLLRKAKRGHK